MAKERDYVNGRAYISSRDNAPVVCNFCGESTTTHIRDPILNTYIWWCEKCQKVPETGWGPMLSMKKPDDNTGGIDIFDVFVEDYISMGFPYVRAVQHAIIQYREWIGRRSLIDLDQISESFVASMLSDKVSIPNVIDMNTTIKELLKGLSEQDRKVLAILAEQYGIVDYLFPEVIAELFKGIDTKGLVKYTDKEKSNFLGFDPKDHTLRAYHRAVDSLVKRVTKTLSSDMVGYGKEVKSILRKKKNREALKADRAKGKELS